jgi:hypothetical protein
MDILLTDDEVRDIKAHLEVILTQISFVIEILTEAKDN